MHQAYELAKKCDGGAKDPKEGAKLAKYWLMALRKVNLLTKHVPDFKYVGNFVQFFACLFSLTNSKICFIAVCRLFADNQIRIAAIKFAMNCPALANDKEIEAETKKMEPLFTEFKATLA